MPTVDLSKGPAQEPAAPTGGTSVATLGSAVAFLQGRSLGELVSGAVAIGFAFVFLASVVTAFAHVPGQGWRGHVLVALSYASFLTAVALLLAMVCLLLLGRSAARGGIADTATVGLLKRPVKDVLAAVLAAESAIVGLGALVSFVLYLSLVGSLSSAGVGNMLADLAVLPVVAATLLWGWADGAAKLKALMSSSAAPSSSSANRDGPSGDVSVTGPVVPPPVASTAADEEGPLAQ